MKKRILNKTYCLLLIFTIMCGLFQGIPGTSGTVAMELTEYSGVIQTVDFRYRAYTEDPGGVYDVRTFTSYGTVRPWAYVNDNLTSTAAMPVQLSTNYTQIYSKVGEWVAYKINVTTAGRYRANLSCYCRTASGLINIYTVPLAEGTLTDKASIAGYLTTENRKAQIDTYSATAVTNTLPLGDMTFDTAGDYLLVFQVDSSNPTSRPFMYPAKLTLNGIPLASVTLNMEADNIGVNEKIFANVTGTLENGSTADLSTATISYTSSNPEIASVNSTTGEITGTGMGTADIAVTVDLGGTVKAATGSIIIGSSQSVTGISIISNPITAVGFEMMLVARANLANGGNITIPADSITYELVSANPTGIATISASGKVTTTGAGIVVVCAQATVRGISYTSEEFTFNIFEVQGSEKMISWNFYGAAGINHDGRSLTTPADDREWIYYADNLTAETNAITTLATSMQIVSQSAEWVAYKMPITEAGIYFAKTEFYASAGGGYTQYYLLPYTAQTAAEITTQLNSINPIGEYYGKGTGSTSFADLGEVCVPYSGDYLVVVRSRTGYIYQRALTLTGTRSIDTIDITSSAGDIIEYNGSTQINATVKYFDGTVMDASVYSIVYRSTQPSIAAVDSTGLVTGKFPGSTDITVIASSNNISRQAVKTITVKDSTAMLSANLSVPETLYVGQTVTLTTTAEMASGNIFSLPKENVQYEIVSSLPEGAVTIDGEKLTCVAIGTATLKATTNYSGSSFSSGEVTVEMEVSGKTCSTIYTDDVRAAILENVNNYPWAEEIKEEAVEKAEQYLSIDDTLWNLPVGEGLPRYYHIAQKYDPDKYICPDCKTDIGANYSIYGWKCDALTDPWKIKCPECGSRFPSNDFESYYKLGLNEHGIFDPVLAKQKNDELIANGEEGYLVNILYPEKDEGWEVDDGFGYYTGKVFDNGVVERHNPIAYYLHNALWLAAGGKKYASQTIREAINALSTAYLYTGDPKYARPGAILLDRVADLYPDFHWELWKSWRPDNYPGKMLDTGWQSTLDRELIYAYDAFYPIYDDPYVINFLSNKAEQYGLDNPKATKEDLTRNVEDNIIRQVHDAAMDYITGTSFGYCQAAVIAGAVVLDKQPETDNWIEWGYASDMGQSVRPRTGLDIMRTLMDSTNNTDRDGNGYQGAPGYNKSWIKNTVLIAEVTAGKEKYAKYDLYKNPKYVKMFTAQMDLTLGNYYTPQIGDTGAVATVGLTSSELLDTLITAYYRMKTPAIAQLIYKCNNNSVDGLHYNITFKDPESLKTDIEAVINQYGEMNLKSKMLTGYGMAIMRDGGVYKSADPNTEANNTTDYAMYFGRGTHHGHDDQLNLFIDAFGLNMAPDLGYPEQTGTQPHRIQFVDQVLSHNTVQVNGRTEIKIPIHGTPYHFDDSNLVKVMDVNTPEVYANTSIYRRTVVMVKANEDTSYAVDFFRVKGGNDHTYSFHSQSKNIFNTNGLNLVPQVDGNGNYVGTMAGPDVPYGPDPNTILTSQHDEYLMYPTGYTWLKNIRRDSEPSTNLSVDFAVTDFRNVLGNLGSDLHLRMTMLSGGYPLSDFTITTGTTPQTSNNVPYGLDSLEYVLARRMGTNLDTLFTTVYEPYREDRYLSGSENVAIIPINGTLGTDDIARAVKVTFNDGRTDYVVYATNNSVTYRVADLFDFRGFTGVYSVKNGELVNTYVNDGDIIGDETYENKAYTGTVEETTREISLTNSITVNLDQDVDEAAAAALAEKYIYVNNRSESPENGAYRIVSATLAGPRRLILNIGDVTLIRGYVDDTDLSKGYLYNINSGQSFRIPLSHAFDPSPVFDGESQKTVDANSEIRFSVNATSPLERQLTYSGVALPNGSSFNPETRTFVWTPDSSQVGTHHVAISVTDGLLTETLHLEIVVLNAEEGKGGEKKEKKEKKKEN